MRSLRFSLALAAVAGALALPATPRLFADQVAPPPMSVVASAPANDTDRALAELRTEMLTRFDAIEKAVTLAHDDLTRVPTVLDKAVEAVRAVLDAKRESLEAVTNEKFTGVATQFNERDKRTEQLTIANSTAIAAALQAQKEAVGEQNKAFSEATDKSNKATSEAITQLQTLFNSNISSLTTQLNDLKSRNDRNEGHSGGTDQTVLWIFAGLGAVGAFFSIILSVVSLIRRTP